MTLSLHGAASPLSIPNGAYTPVASERTASQEYFTLSVLRAASVIFVLLNHLSLAVTAVSSLFATPGYTPLASGVQMFFIISGVVVTLSGLSPKATASSFIMRRVFRLYPGLFIFFAFTFLVDRIFEIAPVPPEWIPVLGCKPDDFVRTAGGVVFGTYNIAPKICYNFGTVWSLSLEFRYYFLVFLALACVQLLRSGDALKRALFLGIAVAMLGYGLYARIGFTLGYFDLRAFSVDGLSYYYDFIGLGIIIALFPVRLRIGRLALTVIGTGLMTGALVALGVTYRLKSGSVPYHINHDEGWGMLCALALYGGTAFLCMSAERHWTAYGDPGLKRGKGAVWIAPLIGAASYGARITSDASYLIYLLQFPAFVLLSCGIRWLAPGIYSVPLGWEMSQIAMVLVMLWPCSYLLHVAVERPAIRFAHRLK